MPSLEFRGMRNPSPTFLHRHTSFEDFNEYGGITTHAKNNSPSNYIMKHQILSPLKMQFEDSLRTQDADEACVDRERLPIMTTVFPLSVCPPNLGDQQHEHTATRSICALNMNHTHHLFQQTTNKNAAGGTAFDRNTIPQTYHSDSITVSTSLSLSATAGRYHVNSTSWEAKVTYDSPQRPLLENHPEIITHSEIAEYPAQCGAVAGINIQPCGDRFQSEVKELSSKTNIAKTASYGLVHYSPNSAFAVKAAHANHTKTPLASPLSSTIRPPTVAAVMRSKEESVGQARKQKSDQRSIEPWLVKFNLLKKYKDEHNGSCDVPLIDPLGVWVNKVC